MKDTNEVTVQIKVEEHDENYYLLKGDYAFNLINKKDCTVVTPVEQQEGEVKGFLLPEKWCVYGSTESVVKYANINGAMPPYHTSKSAGLYYHFPAYVIDYDKYTTSSYILEGYTEITHDQFMKYAFEPCSPPAPVREPIGFYEGVEVFEDTKAWFVDFGKMAIIRDDLSLRGAANGGIASKENDSFSKVYLTPEAVNARLKQIVKEKAKDIQFSLNEYSEWRHKNQSVSYIDFAIEKVEKEFNVTYLTVNTESK